MVKKSIYVVLIIFALTLFYGCTEIEPKVISSIEVISESEDIFYFTEDILSELSLLITYEDGTTQTISVTPNMIKEEDIFKLDTLGNHSITIIYLGRDITYNFEVKLSDLHETLHAIYLLGSETGSINMTYEEWFYSIQGQDGVGISSITMDDALNMIITLTNEEVMTFPISFDHILNQMSFDINELGELVISINDNVFNLGRVTGRSAFETYLLYNPDYSGTEEDWINSFIDPTDDFSVFFYKDNSMLLSVDENNLKVASGTLIELPTASMDGYIFKGWSESIDDISVLYNDDYLVTKDIILFPIFEEASAKIDFYVNDDLIYSYMSASDMSILLPTIEFEDMEYFKGWYIDNQKIDGNYIVTEDLEVYAKFENDPEIFSYNYLEAEDAYELTGFKDGFSVNKLFIPSYYLGKPIVSIGANAFYGYPYFEKIAFNEPLKRIGRFAFAFTGDVEEVHFPSSMKRIGEQAFYDAKIMTFSFDETIIDLQIDSYAFALSYIAEVGYRRIDIPFDYVANLQNNAAIADMYTIITVKEELVEAYNNAVWQANYQLFFPHEIEIKENDSYRYFILNGKVTILRYIGLDQEVVLPSHLDDMPVVRILFGAFDLDILSLSIPQTVEEIGPNSFYGVKEIYFEGNIPPVVIKYPDDIFNKQTMIFVDSSAVATYKNAYTLYTSQIFSKEAVIYDGTYMDFDYTVVDSEVMITRYFGTDDHVVIPSMIDGYPVKTIKSNAFNNILDRVSLYIPESITHIENFAFPMSNSFIYIILDSDVLPNMEYYGLPTMYPIFTRSTLHDPYKDYINLYHIDSEIFINEDALYVYENGGYTLAKFLGLQESFEVPVTVNGQPVLKIGHMAFDNVSYNLRTLTFPETSEVVEIGASAFSRTMIQDLVLPKSVQKIGDLAFAGYYLDRFFSFDDFIINVVVSTNIYMRTVTLTSETIPVIKPDSIILTSIILKVPASLLDEYKSIFPASHLVTLDAEIYENDAWRYAVDQNEVHIYGYYGLGGDVQIPKYIDGYPVVSIASKVFDHYTSSQYMNYLGEKGIYVVPDYVHSIYVPNTMKTLGHHFAYESTLLSIYFEEGTNLTTIENQPFYWGSNVYIHMSDLSNESFNEIIIEANEFGYSVHHYIDLFGKIITEDIDDKDTFNGLIYYALLHEMSTIKFTLNFDYQDIHQLIQEAVNLINFSSSVSQYVLNDYSSYIEIEFIYNDQVIASVKASLIEYYVQLSNGSYQIVSGHNPIEILPIELITKTIHVETSEQLWIAAMNGYKPIPLSGSQAEEVYLKAKEIISLVIDPNMSDIEKLLALHDYMVMNVEYDKVLLDYLEQGLANHTYRGFYLEGALIDQRAVCDGIAKSFVLLGRMIGLEVIYVEGSLTYASYGHAWNKVKIDGIWYNIDITYDNLLFDAYQQEMLIHRYFMVSDDAFEGTRVDVYPYYESLVDYNYYESFTFDHESLTYDYVIESQFELNVLLSYIISKGAITIDFQYDGTTDSLVLMIQQAINTLGLPISTFELVTNDHMIGLIIYP